MLSVVTNFQTFGYRYVESHTRRRGPVRDKVVAGEELKEMSFRRDLFSFVASRRCSRCSVRYTALTCTQSPCSALFC